MHFTFYLKRNAYLVSFFNFTKNMIIIFTMKRILIIGCPGSGKSYLAKKMGLILNLPVIHMDNLYWKKDKTSISVSELENKLKPYLETDSWIIDGNYHDTLKSRLKYATDVFFLDVSREECVQGMLERIDQERDDIPWVETKEDAEELIAWTIDYEKRTKKEEENLLKEYPEVVVHRLFSRKEIDEYIKSLKK